MRVLASGSLRRKDKSYNRSVPMGLALTEACTGLRLCYLSSYNAA